MLPGREPDPTLRAHALAAQLLDRHGILTRAVAPAEGIGARFTDVYRVLSALEQGGQVRRGYFVERLGGSQFALPGAVDRLRVDAQVVERSADEDGPTDLQVVVLAATDPANPYGASLPWPVAGPDPSDAGAGRHRPGRKAGALVVLVDGALVLYLERGGRTVLSFAAGRRRPARPPPRASRRPPAPGAPADSPSRVSTASRSSTVRCTAPLGQALVAAGFAATPRGLRLRDQS